MFLLRYVKQLKGEKNKVCKVLQMAWTFVNDSLCTMLSLQWEPEIIAVAVMYLAGRLCKFDIQEWTAKQSSRRWWEQFVQDVPVELLEDICHQILDLYSQGNKPIPQQMQEKERAPATPTSAPPVSQGQPPATNPPPPPPKKTSPQGGSPTRQLKRSHTSPKDEPKAPEQVGSKIPRLESPMPPLPTPQPPPAPPTEAEPGSETAPPPPLAPPPHHPPPLPHRPPPPPPSNYLMSTTSSYMSGEGYQSLQSMMKTEGPSYSMPPSYAPPMYHVYPPTAAPPPGPPPPTSNYPPPSLPPSYPPSVYNSYPPPPPPRMPPSHVPPPGMALPPTGYPPPPPVPPGQSHVPLPPPPGMPLNRGGWMR